MDQATYEREAETFLTELYLEEYQVGAGLKSSLELAPIYARHSPLFAAETVRERLTAREALAGRYLADFAATGFLANQVKELSEEVANAELAAKLAWDGQDVPFLEVPVRLMNEDDPARRAELARAYHAKEAQWNPLRIRRWNQLHALATGLGFDDYVSAFDELRDLHLRSLAEQLTWLLDVTEPAFEAALTARLAEQGVPRASAGTWDVAALLRGKAFDALYPAEQLLPSLKQTLSGLGIDLDAQRNVTLDTEQRPLKSSRAFCSDIRTPQDVRLVIKPAGGVEDYGSLFHEAGHAEHFAHVDPNLEFPYRRLGDGSVTESYAFLFEHLLHSPAWLEAILALKPAQYEPAVRAARFGLLWMIRRYSAKLNYELELHSGLVDAKAHAYVYWLGRGCRVQIPPQRFLSDVDDGFYAAQYLRAWIFEAQLRRHLENTFGAEWFADRRAGEFLKGLWRVGQRDPVEELARRISTPGLDLNPLLQDITL